MTFNETDPSPSLEKLPGALDLSFRLLSWDGSLANPVIHHGQSTFEQRGGMGDRWHYHPELELTWFSEGEGIRMVGDSIRTFQAPEAVLLGAFLPHRWQVAKSKGIALQFRVGPGSVFGAIPELRELNALWDRAAGGIVLGPSLSGLVGAQLHAAISKSTTSRLGIILEIMGEIGSKYHSERSSFPDPVSSPIRWKSGAASYGEAISKAIDFITHHFQEPITQADVLAHIKMSRATFSRQFSQFTGQSFTEFLQQFRLEHCRRLLAVSGESITRVACESGFRNLSHFNRLFRERWGQTPSEFRRELL